MKNNEIILNAIIEQEVMTEDQVVEYLEQGKMPPVHTYKAWQALGYQVKRGEKAKVKTSIWNRSTKPSKEQKAAIEAGELDPKDIRPYFYMAPAHLFTEDQVERIEDKGKVKRPAKKAPAKKKTTAKKTTKKAPATKKAAPKKSTKAPAKKTKTAANAVQDAPGPSYYMDHYTTSTANLWDGYDGAVAECQLMDKGFVLVHRDTMTPEDNEHVLIDFYEVMGK